MQKGQDRAAEQAILPYPTDEWIRKEEVYQHLAEPADQTSRG
jgi:hypothetical protein